MTVADLKAITTELVTDYDAAIRVALSLPTAYGNGAFAKPSLTTAGAKWARMTVLLGDGAQIEMGTPGNRLHRNVGVLHVAIFVVLDTGEGDALTIANAIASRYTSTTRGGCLFRAPTIEPGERDEGWWRVAVRCPFEASMFK